MIISLNTSTPVCYFGMYSDGAWLDDSWEAGRSLAKELLSYLEARLATKQLNLHDISGIIVYQGPGSFTGLRIGATVMNTLARSEVVPIVGATGDDWRNIGLARLQAGQDDELVLPLYGSEPHITTPRK